MSDDEDDNYEETDDESDDDKETSDDNEELESEEEYPRVGRMYICKLDSTLQSLLCIRLIVKHYELNNLNKLKGGALLVFFTKKK